MFVKFLKRMMRRLKAIALRLLELIDKPVAEATVTTVDSDGQELTSPLVEMLVRRAVFTVITAAGTALLARISQESQITMQVNDAFTRLIKESWYGG